jgi:alpha-N-arabinofuranosidase
VNDFAAPARVVPAAFTGAVVQGGKLVLDVPARALVVLDLH